MTLSYFSTFDDADELLEISVSPPRAGISYFSTFEDEGLWEVIITGASTPTPPAPLPVIAPEVNRPQVSHGGSGGGGNYPAYSRDDDPLWRAFKDVEIIDGEAVLRDTSAPMVVYVDREKIIEKEVYIVVAAAPAPAEPPQLAPAPAETIATAPAPAPLAIQQPRLLWFLFGAATLALGIYIGYALSQPPRPKPKRPRKRRRKR